MTLARAEGLVVATFLVAYLVLGLMLREQYPFSPLSMFSRGGRVTARIVVRGPDGLHPVEHYDGYRCVERPDFMTTDGEGCVDAGRHPELDRAAQDYVSLHDVRGGAVEPVTVLRLSHRIQSRGGPVVTSECPLLRCEASVPTRHTASLR
ncbi:MAG: hypothetical protein J0L92_24895 [Deltaproteobacteria bacterium]|nr:hypothetical protein [Deltaproteobacteria bacterium]